MNQYQFQRVPKYLEQTFGKIIHGQEEEYLYPLQGMESNIVFTKSEHPEITDVDVKKGLLLAMHYLNDRIRQTESDLEKFSTPEAELIKHAVLYTFDPEYNEKVKDILDQEDPRWQTDGSQYVIQETGAKCMVRIYESVVFFETKGGYLRFLIENDFLGDTMPSELCIVAACVAKD